MRVLHVISSLEIGGAQRLLSDLLPSQRQQGTDASLLVLKMVDTKFSKKIEESRVPIISLDVKSFRNPFLAFKVRYIIKDYDVVHAHLVHALYICSLAAIGLNTKLVYTEHNTYNNRRRLTFLRPIEKWIYSRYQKLISVSQQVQDALKEWLQADDNRFSVINNGVDIKSFAAIHQEVVPRSLIMVSRFAPSKDQETVIRAMQLLDKEITLRLVGDGETLDHCKQVAKECQVDNRVFFLGAREDVAELMAASYIGIQSSKWEGFGLTAVEMMAVGLPVIATDVEGLKQVVEGAGELYPDGDYIVLAKLIKDIICDREKYDRMVKLSKERAKNFDISYCVRNYLEVYKGQCLHKIYSSTSIS